MEKNLCSALRLMGETGGGFRGKKDANESRQLGCDHLQHLRGGGGSIRSRLKKDFSFGSLHHKGVWGGSVFFLCCCWLGEGGRYE